MYVLDYWLLPASTFILSFLIFSHLFVILDIFQPSWYKSLEISPRPKVTFRLYTKVMSKTVSHFFISFLIGASLWYFCATKAPEIPSFSLACFQIIICRLFSAILLWTSHFIEHQPALYKRFHALHHAFPRPIALVSLYCSNWEMIFVNLPSLILMPALLQMHPVLNSLWAAVLTPYVLIKHCGHNILPKWLCDTEHHDVHHSTSKGNYGLKMIDKLYIANQKKLEKFSLFQKIVKGNL